MLRYMAWRNIWRNRRRTIITLAAMVFGLFACLVLFAVGDGAHNQMMRLATSSFLGHIQINQQGFQKKQKIDLVIEDKSSPVRLLKDAMAYREGKDTKKKIQSWQRRVKAWTPRVIGAALVSTGEDSSGGFLLGLDLVRESRVTQIPENILKAMAVEAMRSGRYKKRFPKAYLNSIRIHLAYLAGTEKKKQDPNTINEAIQGRIEKAVHRATQEFIKDRKAFEKLLKTLVRPREVVIGKGLAVSLSAKVGGYMGVFAQGFRGSVGNDGYTIVGIVETGNAEMDMSLCITRIEQLQDLLMLEGYYHSLVLSLDTHNTFIIRRIASQILAAVTPKAKGGAKVAAKAVAKGTKVAAAAKSPWEVLPWQKISPELYEFIRADEAGQFVMVFIVFFLVGFIILNTFQMSIMERTHEFGILMSLGMKGRNLVALLLWEGAILAVLAIVIGMALGVPVMAYLQNVGIPLAEPLKMGGIVVDLRLEAAITFQGLVFSPAVVFITTVFVSFYPAFRASRLKPVEALRHV